MNTGSVLIPIGENRELVRTNRELVWVGDREVKKRYTAGRNTGLKGRY